ncbi:transcription factor rap1 [Trichoderma cornu-damae]|uniref:DNA-binding protein RAP1 n=1 Tax=Trichoderma cornu-damae TaxID=654480 RepID=A0A9P8QVR8_9HYPO|nr:transcription factor rap1 [Trichoderma cornu-damae]
MASHITYNGVLGAEGGGDIFKDMKFWVSRMVPQRDDIVAKIQNNSGAVVILEKDADMLIADHARKDAPLGSHSWKFITESVNAGIAQVEDRYLIGPSPSQARRPVVAGPRAKKARTPFTEQDDAIIAKRILERGINTAGNKMYMELEKEADAVAGTSEGNSERPDELPPRASTSGETQCQEVTPLENIDRRGVTDKATSEPSGDATAEQDTTIHRDVGTGEVETEEGERREVQEERQISDAEAEQRGERGEEMRGSAEGGAEEEDVEDDASVDGGQSSFAERDQFFSDLQDYCDANGKGLDMRCIIGDNEVDLWMLFQAASAQSLPPDELDWKRVAEDVGLGWVQNKEVIAALLKSSYDRHLADFVDAMMSFEEDEEGPDEDVAGGDETVVEDGETTADPTTPRASQRIGVASSALNEGGKARWEKSLPGGQPLAPSNLSKRRRTMDTEIPATPENMGGVTRRLSAPGILQNVADQEQTEADEPADMSPSQQLRSETDYIMSPEPIQLGTPTLYYTPTAASHFHWNERHLETIQEEDSSASTPTRPRSKKRTLPESFQRSRPMQLEERRERRRLQEQERRQLQQQQQQERQQKWLEEQRQEELRQEEKRREEQRQEDRRERQQELEKEDNDQQRPRPRPRPQGDASDLSETNQELIEKNQQRFQEWKQHYLEQDYSEEMIIEAMRRTTMTPGILMEAVLQSLRKGEGIPALDQGIWTDHDDAQLRYVDRIGNLELMLEDTGDTRRRKKKAQNMLDKLLYKHTEPRVELRKKFLRELAKTERGRGREQAEKGR